MQALLLGSALAMMVMYMALRVAFARTELLKFYTQLRTLPTIPACQCLRCGWPGGSASGGAKSTSDAQQNARSAD